MRRCIPGVCNRWCIPRVCTRWYIPRVCIGWYTQGVHRVVYPGYKGRFKPVYASQNPGIREVLSLFMPLRTHEREVLSLFMPLGTLRRRRDTPYMPPRTLRAGGIPRICLPCTMVGIPLLVYASLPTVCR